MSGGPVGGLFFQAANRNKEAIGDVLAEVLPSRGLVVEIAAGGGQHAAYFSGRFGHLRWQPTEPQAERRASIEAWRAHTGHENFLEPLRLDVQEDWPLQTADAVYLANLTHVSPREASTALLRGAAGVLVPGGPLCVYGPFKRHGEFTTPSNAAFDQTVKGWHPSYGLRDLEELIDEADGHGLFIDRIVEMPANNFFVIWRKRA